MARAWAGSCVPIRPLAWELPYTMGVALKRQKKRKKKKKNRINRGPAGAVGEDRDRSLVSPLLTWDSFLQPALQAALVLKEQLP